MESFTLTESVPKVLPIAREAALALGAAGRRLASKKSWWGEAEAGSDDEELSERKTVVRCTQAGDEWSVRVSDAVGVVSVPEVQLIIEPKIPLPHFTYLFARGAGLPRLDEGAGLLEKGASFWELLARWFIAQADVVFRRGLARDYESRREQLQVVRGHVTIVPTVRDLLRGRVAIHCEYDDFVVDMPLNRLLAEAARRVTASKALPDDVRRAALALSSRLEVGPLRASDVRAITDRQTAYYTDAVALAKEIIRSTDRDLRAGEARAWTFLVRTPEAVERGVRSILAERLPGRVTKQGLQLTPSYHTLNPDLVFDDGQMIGDVKYKLAGTDWVRSDLFQVVAFAAGYQAHGGSIVAFARGEHPQPPPLQVGHMAFRHFVWRALESMSPAEAGADLANEIEAWLAANGASTLAA